MEILAISSRRFFLPLFYKWYNIPASMKYYRTYKKSQYNDRDTINNLQLDLLRNIIGHAYDNIGFYKQVLEKSGATPEDIGSLKDLQSLPFLTKKDIRENLEQMTAKDIDYDKTGVYSGGTTGPRLKFYRDFRCKAKRLALGWLCDSWLGWEPGVKVSYVWPAMQDVDTRRSLRQVLLEKIITRAQGLPAAGMSERELQHNLNRLNSFRPYIVKGFPSALNAMANYIVSTGRNIDFVRGVVSMGEPIQRPQRVLIEKAFNSKVFNHYSNRENGPIASQCEQRDYLHILADSVIVEIVKDGKPCGPNEFGDIVITDLLNFATPMIRYQTGDMGMLVQGVCSCGRNYPLLSTVVGRSSDNLYRSDGSMVSGSLIAGHLNSDVKAPNINQFQIVQEKIGEVYIYHLPGEEIDPDVEQYFGNLLRRYLGDETSVIFKTVGELKKEESGKLLFIKNLAKTEK